MDKKILKKIILCVILVEVMFFIGSLIFKSISESQKEQSEIYNSAIQITTAEELQKAMNNRVEHCFIYGELKVVDPVRHPDVSGEYAYIQKIVKEYKRHTRTNTYTDKYGKKQTEKKIYWSWDRVDSSYLKCAKMSLCGAEFSSEKINLPSSKHIDTVYNGSNVKYEYYGVGTEFVGTAYVSLEGGTMPENIDFYYNKNINETIQSFESDFIFLRVMFWFFWVLFAAAICYGGVCLSDQFKE